MPVFTSPLLLVHSRGDEIVPYDQGERLFAQANEPKQFLELSGGHNDGNHVSHDIYMEALQQFLGEILPDAGNQIRSE